MRARRRSTRHFASLAVATACVVLQTDRANAKEMVHESASFRMDVAPPGAAVCVVFPDGYIDEGCRGVDLELSRKKVSPGSFYYVVTFPMFSATVDAFVSVNPRHRAWTMDEARGAGWEGGARLAEQTEDRLGVVDVLERSQVGALQVYRRTDAIRNTNTGRDFEQRVFVVGSESVVQMYVTFPEAHAVEGNALVESLLSTVRLPAAPPLRATVGYGTLRLLAGVPLIALFALALTRARARAKSKSTS